MPKKLTTEEFVDKAIIIHGSVYNYSKVKYVGNKKKVVIVCPKHGEFLQRPNDHLNKMGCPKCFGTPKKTTDEFIKNARKIHTNTYDYSKVNYTSNKNFITIGCKIHGDFNQRPQNHLKGQGCPQCGNLIISNKLTLSTEEFIDRSIKIYGNKYDYSKVSYVGGKVPITIICRIHGEFQQTPNSHLKNKYKFTGCQKCSRTELTDSMKLTPQKFIEKSKKIHGEKYDYSLSKYIDNKKKVKIICRKHGAFEQEAGSHMRGIECPRCKKRISKSESIFLDILLVKKENRQHSIKGFGQVDGIDTDKKVIYEFLGDFWHGNPKRFNHTKINPVTKNTFGYLFQKTFDKFRRLFCAGYTVKYIWESDWNNWLKNKSEDIPVKNYPI